jgi:3-keto-5-aminohexanoate cleavage enzyme
VRDRDGAHALDAERYRAAIEAVRRRVGERMVIQITTEAGGRYAPADQMAVIRELRPEAVSLAISELIPDNGAMSDVAVFLDWLRRLRISPQFILYTPAEVARFEALRRQGVIPQASPFALFVLGRDGEPAEVWPRDVLSYLKAHDPDCPWALCAFGPTESACVLTAAGLGGHVRVGFENNLWLADGRAAGSDADLVAQVVGAAHLLGRAPGDIETTRALLAQAGA